MCVKYESTFEESETVKLSLNSIRAVHISPAIAVVIVGVQWVNRLRQFGWKPRRSNTFNMSSRESTIATCSGLMIPSYISSKNQFTRVQGPGEEFM